MDTQPQPNGTGSGLTSRDEIGGILNRHLINCGIDNFPHSTTTAAGRAANRAVVEAAIRRGLCGEHVTVRCDAMSKHGAHDEWSPGGCKMVKAGRRLVEPFGRADLVREARVSEAKAGNTMTLWRKCGWIVEQKAGARGAWVRTSGFGEGTA